MKNKILTISLIFIVLSFVFINNNVFAKLSVDDGTTTHILPNLPVFPDGYSNYIIYIDSSNNSYYLITHKGDSWFQWNTYKGCFYLDLVSPAYCYKYIVNSNDWVSNGTYSSDTEFSGFNSSNTGTKKVIVSTYDLRSTASGYPLFFQKTPVVLIPETLVGLLEEANPTQTFQTMMRGIIPYLIALVVGLVAFWKAWQLLLKELRKA